MKRIALLAAATLLLAGCAAAPAPASDDSVRIVASTNVYGSIAQAIGGDRVSVTSLIANAGQDPHSFEASAQDQLAVSKADVIIENGGGYDEFMGKLESAAKADAHTINVFETFTGSADLIEGYNEHLWYNFEAVGRFADELTTTLSTLDPDNADTYSANATQFEASLDELVATQATIKTTAEGTAFAMTEPVPGWLLEGAGFANATPDAFTEAIEEGSDVPPLALQETLALFTDKSVALLAYNDQTASPETERVRAAAEEAGIPVLNFTETLPDGQDYLEWMTSNLDQIAAVFQ